MEDGKIYELWSIYTHYGRSNNTTCGGFVSKGSLEDMIELKTEYDSKSDNHGNYQIVSPSDTYTYSAFKDLFEEKISGLTIIECSNVNLVAHIYEKTGMPECCYVYDSFNKKIIRPLVGDNLLYVIETDPSIFIYGKLGADGKITEDYDQSDFEHFKELHEKEHERWSKSEEYSYLYTDQSTNE